MRIIHLCMDGTYTDNRTYQENIMVKFHRKMGHDVFVICSRWTQCDDGGYIYDNRSVYVDKNGTTIYRLKARGVDRRNKKLKKYTNLYKTVCEIQPDIIFIHGVAFLDVNNINKYKRNNPKVVIYADNHGDLKNSATNWISKKILHGIIWKHYASKLNLNVRCFYGVLPARVDFLIQMYGLPQDKCKLLLLGADDDMIKYVRESNKRKTIREKFQIDDDELLIMTGGKINKYRPETLELIRAFRRIHGLKVKLLLFGSVCEELRNDFMELIDHPNVIFIGWIDGDKTYELFEAADLVVFPGLHSVLWEQAVAQGVPGIFRKIKGFEHIDLGGNVCLMEEPSEEKLYETMVEIITNGELTNMKTVALELGKEKFSYFNISKECIEN